jgi:hypothetical protein
LVTYYDDGLGGSTLTRTTFAQSVRYIGTKVAFPDAPMLHIVTDSLISQRKEKDPELRRASLEGLATIITGNLSTCLDQVGDIEQFALECALADKSLIEEKDLGPFKIKEDHGLPMSKAAYNLLDILYTTSESVDRARFVEVLISGLVDPAEDKIILCLTLLVKVSNRTCTNVLLKMDSLVAGFEAIFKSNMRLVGK